MLIIELEEHAASLCVFAIDDHTHVLTIKSEFYMAFVNSE